MIDLIIEVPDAKTAFDMVRAHAASIESLEPTGRRDSEVNREWKEWRVVTNHPGSHESNRVIASIILTTEQAGFAAWPYEISGNAGPWFAIGGA